MQENTATRNAAGQKISTRKMAVAGMLGAVAIVLSVTGLGMIPMPTLAGRATIMHVPVILAAILEGPVVGAFFAAHFNRGNIVLHLCAVPPLQFWCSDGSRCGHIDQHHRLSGISQSDWLYAVGGFFDRYGNADAI